MSDLLLEQQVTHPQAEQVYADTADALLGPQRDRDDRIDQAHEGPDTDSDQEPGDRTAGLEDRVVGAERPEQHHAVDAQVEHAAPLADRLAESGQQERRSQPDSRPDHEHQ